MSDTDTPGVNRRLQAHHWLPLRTCYGMGVAVGDYDGDGFLDLYVTQYGRSILYHNNADGTLMDVTEKAGSAESALLTWLY